MANVYQLQGKLDLALEYYAKALEISIAALGEKHPSVGNTYGNMGILHENNGEYSKALSCYEKVYPIRLESLGEDHSSTKEIVEWIAEMKEKLK